MSHVGQWRQRRVIMCVDRAAGLRVRIVLRVVLWLGVAFLAVKGSRDRRGWDARIGSCERNDAEDENSDNSRVHDRMFNEYVGGRCRTSRGAAGKLVKVSTPFIHSQKAAEVTFDRVNRAKKMLKYVTPKSHNQSARPELHE